MNEAATFFETLSAKLEIHAIPYETGGEIKTYLTILSELASALEETGAFDVEDLLQKS